MVNKELNIEEVKHNLTLIIVAIIFLFLGVIAIITSYFLNKLFPGSIGAFLCLNLGALVTMGAAYNLISESFLKRNFAKQIRKSIDRKLERLSLDETIQEFGLDSIQQPFSISILMDKISSSEDVLMLAVKNEAFFSTYSSRLRKQISDGDLKLTILILNPSSRIFDTFTPTKFPCDGREKESSRFKDVINELIKKQIYDKLPSVFKSNVKLYLFEEFPLYSVYVFDDEELWFIPYFYQHHPVPTPVFVFKGKQLLKNNEIYKDVQVMLREINKEYNLDEKII